MKAIVRITALLLFGGVVVSAQEEALESLVNIVNLVPGDQPCKITLGGISLVDKGLEAGIATGWFYYPAGSVGISVETKELKSQSGTLDLEVGFGKVVVIYLEPSLRKEKDGKPIPPKIRMRSFPGFEGKAYALKIVSLCQIEDYFKIGPLRLQLKPGQTYDIPDWNGSGFDVAHDGKPVGKVEKPGDKGSYYLFIGPGKEEGKYFAAMGNADLLKDNRVKP